MGSAIFAPEHPCTVVLTDKATGQEIDRSETTAELLAGHITVIRITWNALAVSGGVRWWNPRTGQTYPRGITMHVETTHPETGEPVWVDPPM